MAHPKHYGIEKKKKTKKSRYRKRPELDKKRATDSRSKLVRAPSMFGD